MINDKSIELQVKFYITPVEQKRTEKIGTADESVRIKEIVFVHKCINPILYCRVTHTG